MSYANASDCVPEPCEPAGTPLKPFCLGHHLLFVRLGLPFADSPLADASEDQILEGISLCAGASYESTLAAILSGEWEGVFLRWLHRLKKGWRKSGLDWNETEALFRAYLADGYHEAPTMRHESSGGIKFTAPWEQLLKCRLVMAGFDESAVINGYLPGRWYDYFTVCELRGVENCKTQDDARALKPVFMTREMRAKLDAIAEVEAAGNG